MKCSILITGDIFPGKSSFELSNDLSNLFSSADLVVGNLESSLSNQGQRKTDGISLRSSPATALCLKKAGFDVVTLANNHVLDYGVPALEETFCHLQQMGIKWVGAGLNFDRAVGQLISINGVQIGLIGCAQAVTNAVYAGTHSAGVFPCEKKALSDEISRLNEVSDHIIVMPHWGYCDVIYPPVECVQLDDALIGAGATAVVGHHSHTVQGCRWCGNAQAIAYSLGNFYFAPYHDRGKMVTAHGEGARGAVAYLELDRTSLLSMRLIPVRQVGSRIELDDRRERDNQIGFRSRPLKNLTQYPAFWKRQMRKHLIKRICHWANPINLQNIDRRTMRAACRHITRYLRQ